MLKVESLNDHIWNLSHTTKTSGYFIYKQPKLL